MTNWSRVLVRRSAQELRRRRWFSAGYSIYEYPMATEAPVITKTNAAELSADVRSYLPTSPRDDSDPFDDSKTLSDLEAESIRNLQKKLLPTELKGSTKIGPQAPAYIPPNVSASSLEVPETNITTLDNGVRVVSQETYGQVCSIGILGDFGSRHEEHVGVAHLVELMAFQATSGYQDSVEIQQNLQDWGATSFANSGREQTLWCLDILRPNVEKGMEMLKQVTLEPKLEEWEIENSKMAMQFIAEHQSQKMPEIQLGEALQAAAYGLDQQLGKFHFAPLQAVAPLTRNHVHDFLDTNLWKNPNGMVVAGAGISHDELVDMAKYHFGGLVQSTSPQTVNSTYRGGQFSVPVKAEDGFTRVALALEVGGWHSDDLVPCCVLQTLLGGGSSFSAGGPGKGMYSRLYRQVLNRYHWAESAEAFTFFHSEGGLFGISGASAPEKSRELTRALGENLLKLAAAPVSDEELDRARNMLKNNVLSQLESRLVLFEDMGRQVLTYGKREDNAAMMAKIDSVSKEVLQSLMLRAVSKNPTLASVGEDVSNVPSYEEATSWFSFYEGKGV